MRSSANIRARGEVAARANQHARIQTKVAIRADMKASGAAIKAQLRTEIPAAKSDLLRHMDSAMAEQRALLLRIAFFFSLYVK
jgi:hypothetical protein